MNWHICSPSFAPGVNAFPRTDVSGEKPATILELAMKGDATRCRFQSDIESRDFCIAARIAVANFRAFGRFVVPLHVWPVVGRTTKGGLINDFACAV